MINNDQNHVLYIEPLLNQKSINPQDDCITEFMQELWDRAKSHKLVELHRGFHTVCDGTNCNGVGLLNIKGDTLRDASLGVANFSKLERDTNTIQTHAGCVHYLRWFRQAIPSYEWQKMLELANQFDREELSYAIHIELKIAKEHELQPAREHAEQVAEEVAKSGEDFMSDLLSDMPTYEA